MDATLPVSDVTEPVPEAFAALVRDALAHLYDYAHLEQHPLAALVGSDDAGRAAKGLRNLLLDTVEELHPGEKVTRNDRSWRPYGVLVARYVDGYEVNDILASMHLSLRQFQREHRKGLLAVASILYRQAQAHLGAALATLPELSLEEPQAADGPDGEPEVTGASASALAPAGNGQQGTLSAEVLRLGVRTQTVSMGALLDQVLAQARVLAERQGVILRLEGDPDVALRADLTLLRQALLGALSAVISSSAPVITLSWQREADCVVIRLTLPPPSRPLADEEREALRSRLASVSDLLRAQGGGLALVDDPTEVGLTLRVPRGEGTFVLVVDDNERMLQLFERYLTSEGYRFQGVGDAAAVLALLERERPEVIIMDVMMRDMDGWQLLQRLRARPELAATPVIVCSVLDEPELARALGAQAYLIKPVAQQQVLAAVRQVLEAGHSSAATRPAAR
jgi:CheY-like chemotaxis protein